ncbi:MAG: PQ-loop domain-containing transporter [Candidatus Bathyarchaeota archaeon]
MEITIEVIGIIAGLLTSLSFFPQVFKAYKTRSSTGLSLHFLLVFLVGVMLWTYYGIEASSLAIVFSNILASSGISLLIILKIQHKRVENVNSEGHFSKKVRIHFFRGMLSRHNVHGDANAGKR